MRRGKLNSGTHFWRALTVLDNMRDCSEKRRELTDLSVVFSRVGCYNLSLMAINRALEMDKNPDTPVGDLTNDLIAIGNTEMSLGNFKQATKRYRQVIEISLSNNNFANAASASTNLANILATTGDMSQATTLLKSSLQYLAKESFPETEFVTRLLLIKVLDIQKTEPSLLIENAEILFNHYSNNIPAEEKDNLNGAIKNALPGHFASYPEIEPQTWIKRKFPWLAQNGA